MEDTKNVVLIGSISEGGFSLIKRNDDSGKIKLISDKCDNIIFNKEMNTVTFIVTPELDRTYGVTIRPETLAQILEQIEKSKEEDKDSDNFETN